jgi:hypothetical protein
MQNSPDFGNYLHQHPDLLLAPQLQNLSYHFFNLVQHHPFSIIKEFSRGKIQPDNAAEPWIFD